MTAELPRLFDVSGSFVEPVTLDGLSPERVELLNAVREKWNVLQAAQAMHKAIVDEVESLVPTLTDLRTRIAKGKPSFRDLWAQTKRGAL